MRFNLKFGLTYFVDNDKIIFNKVNAMTGRSTYSSVFRERTAGASPYSQSMEVAFEQWLERIIIF